MYTRETELAHYGIKGMKWGIRRYQNENGSLTSEGKARYAKDSGKSVKVNSDGSSTIPKGFVFNRVGKSTLDVNKSGGLYVSYGKEDAARYVKSLGPTKIGKLLGTYGEAVQHISAKQNLKMPSDSVVAGETAKLLSSNKKIFKDVTESFYSMTINDKITNDYVQKAIKNPSGKEAQRLSYVVSSMLGDPNYAESSKSIYQHFRNLGYDAIPDVHDRMAATSKTAMIVINPDKIKVDSVTRLTKDDMKSAKKYVKSLEKLKISDLLS